MPTLNVVLVAVYRHSSVVKDDQDVRVIMRERSGVETSWTDVSVP
jgi:hypothetical protein